MDCRRHQDDQDDQDGQDDQEDQDDLEDQDDMRGLLPQTNQSHQAGTQLVSQAGMKVTEAKMGLFGEDFFLLHPCLMLTQYKKAILPTSYFVSEKWKSFKKEGEVS